MRFFLRTFGMIGLALGLLVAPLSGAAATEAATQAAVAVSSAATSTASQTSGNAEAQPESATPTPRPQYCPLVSTLHRSSKTLYWSSIGSWKSYNQSFVLHVTHFVAAEWQGVNVGVIICLYQGDAGGTFPVELQRSNLEQKPAGYGWGADKNGKMICASDNPYDCPFFPPPTVKPINIYQQLDFFKTGKGGGS